MGQYFILNLVRDFKGVFRCSFLSGLHSALEIVFEYTAPDRPPLCDPVYLICIWFICIWGCICIYVWYCISMPTSLCDIRWEMHFGVLKQEKMFPRQLSQQSFLPTFDTCVKLILVVGWNRCKYKHLGNCCQTQSKSWHLSCSQSPKVQGCQPHIAAAPHIPAVHIAAAHIAAAHIPAEQM